jgi:hypothetical protein
MKTKQIKKRERKYLNEKREFRGYKIPDTIYKKCMAKAGKNGTTVANLIEDYLYDYAE